MKRLLHIILVILILFSEAVFAQERNSAIEKRNQLKLKKLEENVLRAETRVNVAKEKINSADSLIRVGKDMEKEAIMSIIMLEKEAKEFVKQQNTEYKVLNKQRRKASGDELKEISDEIKELDLKYKSEIRDLEKKLKAEYKKLQKGMLNQDKGKEKLKQYSRSLDDYLDLLRVAEKKLEEFKLEME